MDGSRGRIVLLVGNDVAGDSRAQQSAEQLAHLGWSVTLLELRPTAERETSRLGSARVIQLPIGGPGALANNPPLRSARHPLAYPSRQSALVATRATDWRAISRATEQAESSATALGGHYRRIRDRILLAGHRIRLRQTHAAELAWEGDSLPAHIHGVDQWRWDSPNLADADIDMGRAIQRLRPDLIHAYDVQSLPIATRSAARLQARFGTRPKVVFDAREYRSTYERLTPRKRRASLAMESEAIGRVDGVIADSESMAQLLVDSYDLATRPLVVADEPKRWSGTRSGVPEDVRSEFGFDDDVPVILYLGEFATHRGIGTMVKAMSQLPNVQLVVLTRSNPDLTSLLEEARKGGYHHQIHVRDYVAPELVASYSSAATALVLPFPDQGDLNHSLASPTQLLETVPADSPLTVADLESVSQIALTTGVGEPFVAGDPESFISAATKFVENSADAREVSKPSSSSTEGSPEKQSSQVSQLYSDLLGCDPPFPVAHPVQERLVDKRVVNERDVQLGAAELVEASDDLLESDDSPSRDVIEAIALADNAAKILFNQELHFAGETSPLADQPQTYLRNWYGSRMMQRLQEGNTRKPQRHDRTRALILTYNNQNFVESMRESLESLTGHVDIFDIRALADGDRIKPSLFTTKSLMRLRLQPSKPHRRLLNRVRELVKGYDVIVLDWCTNAAPIVSALDDLQARLIIRLHSMEAFSVLPHLVNWANVDDLVFVSEHLRDFSHTVIPATSSVPSHVIPIAVDAAAYRLPKRPEASHTVGLIGWGAPAKDAPWAMKVLELLRLEAPEFRLLLVGSPPVEGWAEYAHKVERRGQDFAGAVEWVPHTKNVATVLQRIGYVLSSSVREGCHVGLAEGAASRALPVVRDWPMFRDFNGARTAFPSEWAVDSPEQAAERILAYLDDKEREQAGEVASEWVGRALSRETVTGLWRDVLDVGKSDPTATTPVAD